MPGLLDIAAELRPALLAKKCPFLVVVAPERTPKTATWGNERVVVGYANGDKFDFVRSQHINPKQVATMALGLTVTIYAKSPKAGALPVEHQERAQSVARLVVPALARILRSQHTPPTFVGGAYSTPDDLAAGDAPGGAVYTIALTVLTGMPDADWTGAAADEFVIGANGMTSTTKVSLAGASDDAAGETACGA